jgi:hypothetical protein
VGDFVSISPKGGEYEVKNHHGAVMGFASKDNSDYWWFYPKKDWTNYSSAQLKEIARLLDELNKE